MTDTDEDPDAAGAGTRGEDDDVRMAELDRINSKLERLSAQRRALRKAMGLFGENFDARSFDLGRNPGVGARSGRVCEAERFRHGLSPCEQGALDAVA